MIGLLKEIRDNMKNLGSSDADAEAKAERVVADMTEELALLEEQNKQLGVSHERNDKIYALRYKLGEITKEQYVQQKALNDAMAEGLEIADKMADEFDGLFKTLTGVTDNWKNSAFGKLMQPGGFNALQQSFRKTFTAANI